MAGTDINRSGKHLPLHADSPAPKNATAKATASGVKHAVEGRPSAAMSPRLEMRTTRAMEARAYFIRSKGFSKRFVRFFGKYNYHVVYQLAHIELGNRWQMLIARVGFEYGGPSTSHLALVCSGVFNAPCGPRSRLPSEAFRDRLPAAAGHTNVASVRRPTTRGGSRVRARSQSVVSQNPVPRLG